MAENFLLGCPCGNRVKVTAGETRKEIRCPHCSRYIKIPPLHDFFDLTTQSLVSGSKESLIGKILAKRYKIESYIADGAMGRIYRGTDLSLNMPVAVKILKASYLFANRQEKRFLQEAQIASSLAHPGIVSVRNFHRSSKGGYFMVMDLCPGRSLKSILETRQHLDIAEVISIGKQVLAALAVAHARGIIHRDIKPANIMIAGEHQQLQAKILDFGIAKVLSQAGGLQFESLTRTGFIIGTTKYMAPEQILKKQLSAATDIYGLGMVLYEAVAGSTAFDGTREQVLRAILRQPPKSLLRVGGEINQQRISRLFDAVIQKALAKNPQKRYQHAEEFITALELCQSQPKLDWQALKLLAQNYAAHLRREMIWPGVLLLALALIWPLLHYRWQKQRQNQSYRQQAEQALAQNNYRQAYHFLRQINSNDPTIAEKRRTCLIRGFWYSCRRQNQKAAYDFLRKLAHETDRPYLGTLLAKCLHEQLLLEKIDRLLTAQKYAEALQALLAARHKEKVWDKSERTEWTRRAMKTGK